MVPWQTELVEEVLVFNPIFSLKIVPIIMCTYGYTRKEITCSLSTGQWTLTGIISPNFSCLLPHQAMAISDLLCILGYLLITFSQVFPSVSVLVYFYISGPSTFEK